jgi:membrane fusion protein (multidrug efflux system)
MLLDGMMVKLNLNLSSEKLPMIPLKSVVYIGDERYVYVLGENDTVNRVKVSLGTVNGTNIAIKSGLQLDSLIVVEGAENLDDNERVKVLNNSGSIINNDVPLKRKKNNNEIRKLQSHVDKEG